MQLRTDTFGSFRRHVTEQCGDFGLFDGCTEIGHGRLRRRMIHGCLGGLSAN
jgi:hypothetical protein